MRRFLRGRFGWLRCCGRERWWHYGRRRWRQSIFLLAPCCCGAPRCRACFWRACPRHACRCPTGGPFQPTKTVAGLLACCAKNGFRVPRSQVRRSGHAGRLVVLVRVRHMPQCIHRRQEVVESVVQGVHSAGARAECGRTAAVHEAAGPVDEVTARRRVLEYGTAVPLQRLLEIEVVRGHVAVRLDVEEPEEHPREPLELLRSVADQPGVLAEVEIAVRKVAVGLLLGPPVAVVVRAGEVVVQLADVAPSGGLDDASPPPAATLHVAMHGPAGGVDLVGVRASLRPAALVGEAALVLPAVGVAVGGVNAVVHGLQVVGRELRNLRVPCRAALLRVIPPRQRVARHGPRRAEQRRRSPRPAGHGPGAHRHAGVLGALHVPLREVARVLAVVLPHLPARGRHGVGGQAAAAAVVVLVAHVVLDGLAEALRQEQRDVGEGLLHGVAQQEVLAAQALLHHELVGLHHVRPPVHGGLLPAASRLLGHQDVLVHDALREVAVQRLQHLRQQLRVVGGRRRQQQAHRRSGGCDARPELHGVGLDPNERTYVCICINARFVSFLLLSTRCLSWMLLLDAARG
mmetsp:Transcript_22269/g.63129  ORF Transcript_22269/g.63129 Transcript_22269/m.63129 type:complete len:574 (-) Transcript_22269:64-1785(-)